MPLHHGLQRGRQDVRRKRALKLKLKLHRIDVRSLRIIERMEQQALLQRRQRQDLFDPRRTARSPGLAVELRLVEAATLVLVKPGKKETSAVHALSMMFTPTRPGALLADAGTRRIRVG